MPVTSVSSGSGLVVSSGSELDVVSGGLVTSTSVLSGGTLRVLSGGEADQTSVGPFGGVGGTLIVDAGGLVSSAVVIARNGSIDVFGSATGLLFASHGFLTVEDGGTVSNTLLFGSATVSSGGSAVGTTISSTTGAPGSLTVSSGGSVTGTTLVQSGTVTVSGTSVDDLALGGTYTIAARGTASGLTFETGTLNVFGKLDASVVSGGAVTVTGVVSGTTLSGVAVAIDRTGSAVGTQVSAGATLSAVVSSGTIDAAGGLAAFTVSTVLHGGGEELVGRGGVASGTTVMAGGLQLVTYDDFFATSAGFGVAYNTVIEANASQRVGSTGSAVGALVAGTQSVGEGGVAIDATVSAGGFALISAGGSSLDATILASGMMVVFSGGYAAGEVLSGGTLLLEDASSNGSPITFAGAAVLELGEPVTTATLSGLAPTDKIDLIDHAYNAGTDSATVTGSTLTVVQSSGNTTLQLDPAQSYAADTFTLSSDGVGGTYVVEHQVPCFCRGTLIATDRGAVAVEALVPGDSVVTAGGEAKPVRWIGRRSYTARTASGRPHLHPVRIRAGALGDGVPSRDLWVSPLHAMLLDGVLVPAWALVNETSIVRERWAGGRLDYFHVELDGHDVLFAEGAASETFVDDESRFLFQNLPDRPCPSGPARYCAPRVQSGFALEAIRRRLARRVPA